jgi:exosortase/archaeosortase family protein
MESRFAVIGRASVRLAYPPPMPPRRRPEVFGPLGPVASGGWREAADPLTIVGAFALALWPHWRWAAARLADGSDDPLGLAALAVLFVAVLRVVPRLRRNPAPGRLATAVLLTAAATALGGFAPPLLAALVAALAFAAALAAFLPAAMPALPLAGLAALALPVVSSLQFYAGFPLRVVTAQASTWLLSGAGFAASRSGSAMVVDGRLVIVDAPCSGVQMAWMAWFCACAVAIWRDLPDRVFARRIALVGAIVLLGNVLRNTALVGLEAAGTAPSARMHEAIGAVVLAAVCAGVAAWIGRRPTVRPPTPTVTFDPRSVALRGRLRIALLALLATCALASLVGFGGAPAAAPDAAPIESPRQWEGRPLRPLALDEVEARFAAQFPGRIERLTDERSVLVWRQVRVPTRMLHPATDCYRGLGYRVADARLERDAEARLWRCFIATRDGRRVRVCERIEDAAGATFTDTSAWFWAARLGRSTGPWQAFTIATPLGSAT